jgi:protein-S-isoprenylcysteine O-methyltransferase Ste14
MSRGLELKIPPPFVALFFGLLMWLASRAAVAARVAYGNRALVVATLAAIGIVFGFPAMGAFVRARTTMNPTRPAATTSLVTHGVYRVTRNPMYLSLVMYLVAWAAYLANWAALLLVPPFVLYITRFQILPEERALSELYGPEYGAYKARVRRWL